MHCVVYGYLATARGDEGPGDKPRSTAEFYARAQQEGFELRTVFTDDYEHTLQVDRPGFTALLEALDTGEPAAVLVPALHHLSWHPGVQARRVAEIERSGARLHVLPAGEMR